MNSYTGVSTMGTYKLNAWSVAKEIELNALAKSFGIPKRFTWEEPIILSGDHLKDLVGEEVEENISVFFFSFGSIVLSNGKEEWMKKIIDYLKEEGVCKELVDWKHYHDEYDLYESEEEDLCNDNLATIKNMQDYHIELSAVVLAKSVALERNEYKIETILNKAEELIDGLERGRTNMSDKKLGTMFASVLRHEYDSVSYILILDKPDITWLMSDANEYYEKLSNIFELSDRYEILKQKTDTLRHIVEEFTSVTHGIRSYVMEVIIIILILVEVVLMILELFV